MNENIYRIFAALILVTGVGISIYHRQKADKDSGESVSNKDEGTAMFLALRLGGLLMWLTVFAYVINPAWLAWTKLNLPDSIRWAAIVCGLACDALIYWLFRSIGQNISPTVGTRSAHRLVKSGPYRWVRNPLYTIGTAFIISFGLIADSWLIVAMALLAFSLLAARLPNEESHLIEKFGDEYREYMRTTGAFLPRLKF